MKFFTSRSGRSVAAILVSSGLVLTAGCGGGSSQSSPGDESGSGSSNKKIKLVHDGSLTACTHLPYKPFEFKKGGTVVGFEPSIVKLLADKLDVHLNVVDIGWSQITSGAAFAAKKCDIGMGAATITSKRKKSVLFSHPFFDANQALLVKRDKAYKDLSDLKGKKLGVQTDTTGQIYAKKHKGKYGYNTIVYDDSISEFQGLTSGKVQAVINDNAPELYFAKKHSGVKITKQFHTGEHYGFMAKKNDANATKMMNRLNAVIARAKKDGTYKKIFKKWFGAAPDSITSS
jgi:polar amino acid transport system substrate-binding protein